MIQFCCIDKKSICQQNLYNLHRIFLNNSKNGTKIQDLGSFSQYKERFFLENTLN